MKLRSALVLLLFVLTAIAADRALPEVKNVYLLPMSSGFDQHLATRITEQGRYTVVTDAAQADAVFTDRIGESFEMKFAALYPPPPPPPEKEPEPAADKEKEKGPDKPEEPSLAALFGEASNQGQRSSSFSRSKGNIFLVDRQTRQVLWSTWLRPRSSRPDDLHKAAGDVVERLDDSVKDYLKRTAAKTDTK